MRRIVLLGPPAVGKGTQAALIRERFDIPTVSTGEALREELAADTALGREANDYTSRGQLFPDGIALQLVEKWMDAHDGAVVFDGFPRSIPQAVGLSDLLLARNQSLDVALSLEAGEETIRRRVLNRMVCDSCKRTVGVGMHIESAVDECPTCGGTLVRRTDDTLETLALRMREYETKSKPLVEHYRKLDLLETIPSEDGPEVVFERVSEILEAV